MSQLFNPFELYPQLQSNLKISNKIPLEEIAGYSELVSSLKALHVRVLIRYSGTENLLRILLEGKDERLLTQKMEEVEEFLKKALNG